MSFQLSKEGTDKVLKELKRYEARESAIIPALYIAQTENKGWVNDDVVRHLSQVMDLPESKINEVFRFYTMFNQKPVGRHHIQVCATLSCHVNGAGDLIQHLCRELRVGLDEVTKDGKFTISRAECLGSCGTAPMMEITSHLGDQSTDKYYENLTPESAMNILRGLP